MYFKSLVLCLLFCFCNLAAMQGQSFKTLELLRDSTDQALNLRFESVSFVKNNEFNSDFTAGFTGIGFSLKPSLEYWASRSTRINTGVFLLKYSGQDKFFRTIPIFTVQQKLGQNLDLVLGSIYGNLNHELDEPLYRIDHFYQDNVEYGLQLLYQKPKIKTDLWLAWNEFILNGDSFQEQFTAGVNLNLALWEKNKLTLSLPFQFMFFHYGGEIDTSPDPVLSIINSKIGLLLNYVIKDKTSFCFDPALYVYNGFNPPVSGVHAQAFDKGLALYLKAHLQHKNLKLSFAYWKANQFIAPRGEYLLLSVGELGSGVSSFCKSFMNAGFNIHRAIKKSIRLEFDARGYYDLENQKFSHALGLYFFINELFPVKQF